MDLKPLFEMQRVLDDRIIDEKGLEGQDLLPEKILALQVELGELANEWRGFKFWSENREPRTVERLTSFYAAREGKTRNPLLEEYVDCLHFTLSIGLEREYTLVSNRPWKLESITHQFIEINYHTSTLNYAIDAEWDEEEIHEQYQGIVSGFLGLGEMLGFTWEQIEQAYKEKNRINHKRQSNGY
jgi:dimeric dUTPase (all-alpha-NTP-PPase superfamily)